MRRLTDFILMFAIFLLAFLLFRQNRSIKEQSKQIENLSLSQNFAIFSDNGKDTKNVTAWLKAMKDHKNLDLAMNKSSDK